MKSLNVYLSGTEREKLIDVLNDYIHMITAIYQDVDTIYSGTETVNVISKKYKLKTERKTLK